MNGNCKGVNTDIFYEVSEWAKAATYCRGCPVIAQCRLEFANDSWAYAGGMTPTQRAAWNRQRKAPPARKTPGRGRGVRIEPDQVAQILHIFDTEMVGSGVIARRVGVSKSGAQRVLRMNNRQRTEEEILQISREGGARASKTRSDGDTTRMMVRKLYDEGYSPTEIAEMVGISRSHVYAIHTGRYDREKGST